MMNMEELRQLKPLKWYKQLATREGRLDAQAFIIEGEHAIRQIASSYPGEILELVSTRPLSSPYNNYPVRLVNESQFNSISTARTPQGILVVIRLPVETYSDNIPDKIGRKLLLLEDIQDPGNMGTLIRTSVAFNFSGIILTKKCADPFSPKSVQSTAGSVLSAWIRRTGSYLHMIKLLKGNGYSLIAADLNGDKLPSVLHNQSNFILALGNESYGISEQLLNMANYRMRIPIDCNKVESLNVAACGAILMYESSIPDES